MINNVRSGGVCVNDTIFHIASSAVPFGGVGPSGLGGYHGKYKCADKYVFCVVLLF